METSFTPAKVSHPTVCPVNLSIRDNSEYQKGRSKLVWAIWHFVGAPILKSNALPFPVLKAFILRIFGASIGKGSHIKPGVKVKFPWFLSIGDYCWIGEDVWIDNLANVTIGSHVCVSQGAYLCTGNHDWTAPNLKLFRRPITLEDGSWVGAKATICPNVVVGTCSIVTVGSVALKSIPPYQIWGGNPAKYLRDRVVHEQRPT
jgi:putative colanic acid biosynthesis acetyltransferase WcaF